VKNVPPGFVGGSLVATASAGGVVVEGDVTDASPVDMLLVAGAVGNPLYPPSQIPMTCSMGPDRRHFRCEHTHQPNLQARTYTINLKAKDDDGGQSTHTMTVRFGGLTRP
jgi:hypothetical protein